MGVKENARAIFINADNDSIENMNLPALDIATKLEDEFDYIHLFVKSRAEFIKQFPKLKIPFKTKRHALDFMAEGWQTWHGPEHKDSDKIGLLFWNG